MTREEAIVELELAARFCVNISALSMAQNIANAIAVLREPQIDENGLARCGCGGKAKLVVQIESNYSVRCEKCGFRSGVLVGWEPAKTDTIKAWNTAMGVKEDK